MTTVDQLAPRQVVKTEADGSTTDRDTATKALDYLAPWRADDRREWLSAGMSLHSVSTDLLPVWKEWSQQSDKYIERDCERQWRSFKIKENRVTIATLIKHAKDDSGGRFKIENRNGSVSRVEPNRIQQPQPIKKTYGSFESALAGARKQVARTKEVNESEVRHVHTWTYHNADGTVSFKEIRFDLTKNGKPDKSIRPIHHNGRGHVIGDPKEPLPLYMLPEICNGNPDRVYVCEGPKAADAARSVGLVATTSAHGAGSAKRSDWTPLAGHNVVILPDHDKDGERYAHEIAQLLSTIDPAPTIQIVDLPGLPLAGDMVEFVEARESVESDEIKASIDAMADEAELWQPQQSVTVPPTPSQSDDLEKHPIVIRLADVEPEKVEWLWRERFAMGKVSMLVGDPGLGKSIVTLDIGAHVSRGVPFPDSQDVENPIGSVVILTAEDDLGDTVRPRLDAANADSSRVIALQAIRHRDPETGAENQTTFCLQHDLPELERAIEYAGDTRLVIIDPVTAYLGSVDSHKNADIRGVLAPLAELASRRKVAIVCVTHLNKNSAVGAMYRAMGSLAFVAAARAVWCVVKDKDEPTRRLVLPIKNNLAPDLAGLSYDLRDMGNGVPSVHWDPTPVSTTVDEALDKQQQRDDDDDGSSAVGEAGDWLQQILGEGRMPQREIKRLASSDGHAWRTVRRAKDAIGIVIHREGFGPGSVSYWSIDGQGLHT